MQVVGTDSGSRRALLLAMLVLLIVLPGVLRNILKLPNTYNIKNAISLISEVGGISINEDNETVPISYRGHAR